MSPSSCIGSYASVLYMVITIVSTIRPFIVHTWHDQNEYYHVTMKRKCKLHENPRIKLLFWERCLKSKYTFGLTSSGLVLGNKRGKLGTDFELVLIIDPNDTIEFGLNVNLELAQTYISFSPQCRSPIVPIIFPLHYLARTNRILL